MALQKAHVASILKQAITTKKGSFMLGVSSGLPPLFLVDLLHAIGGGFDLPPLFLVDLLHSIDGGFDY
jgi:hypothetical protein